MGVSVATSFSFRPFLNVSTPPIPMYSPIFTTSRAISTL